MIRQLAILLILFLASGVYGAEELLVRDSVPVYSEPNKNSSVMVTLERGDKVPISPREYGRFRKVLVEVGGKKRPGYVLKSTLEGSRIRSRQGSAEKDAPKLYHRRLGAGLMVVPISYASQGAWKFDSGDGAMTEISQMKGYSNYFGVSLDFPMDSAFVLRAELVFRSINQTGTTKPLGGSSKAVQRKMSFFGAGATAKYYLDRSGDFWVGGGAELARANQISLVYADTEKVPVEESSFPTYFILKGAVGQDYQVFGDFYINPEARLCYAVNTSPAIWGIELVVNINYGL